MLRRLLLVTVGPDEVDLVTDVLWSVGVDAIEERQTPDGVTLVTEATESLVGAVGRRWPSGSSTSTSPNRSMPGVHGRSRRCSNGRIRTDQW